MLTVNDCNVFSELRRLYPKACKETFIEEWRLLTAKARLAPVRDIVIEDSIVTGRVVCPSITNSSSKSAVMPTTQDEEEERRVKLYCES